jgi:serine/threonine protein kinase
MSDVFGNSIDAKRAYREIHILRHLNHPNVIRLVDVISPTISSTLRATPRQLTPVLHIPADNAGSSGVRFQFPPNGNPEPTKRRRLKDLGDLYIAMDFVDTDLSKIIKSNQYMLIGHIEYILYQLLLGLKYIHSACVIHRDLKPANILVSCKNCSIKIADFGLSRVVGQEEVDDQSVGSAEAPTPGTQFLLPPQPPTPTEPSIPRANADRHCAGSTPVVPQSRGHTPAASGWMDTAAATNSSNGKPSTVMSILSQARNSAGLSLLPTQQPTLSNTASAVDLLGPADESVVPRSAPPAGSRFSVKRQFTHHVITRWYRAPEVILSGRHSSTVQFLI